jgi:hypothetical protein
MFALALFVIPPAYAQNSAPSDFVLKMQEEYRRAKNSKEVASITAYCKAKVSSFTFKERDGLSVKAIKLLEADNVDEANVLFKRVNSLEELDENLAKMICKPK